MKVEVEVIHEFSDLIYGKNRKIGDIFICDKETALQRANFEINGKKVPLVKILRTATDVSKEEEKVDQKQIKKITDIFHNNNLS